MKNKILKAIDNAVYGVLSTDIPDRDIDFDHDNLDNQYDPLANAVKDLLNDVNPIETAEFIFKAYKDAGVRYKVKDKYELNNILEKIIHASNMTFGYRINMPNWLEMLFMYNNYGWLDTSDFLKITVIDKKGIEQPLKRDFKKGEILFIKITNDELDGNEILLLMDKTNNFYNGDTRIIAKWQSEKDYCFVTGSKKGNDKDAYKDFDGFAHTVNALETRKNMQRNLPLNVLLPAMYLANKVKINAGHNIYQGYLPAVGQLRVLYEYRQFINNIIKYNIHSDAIIPSEMCWSSTEYQYSNDERAYLLGKDRYMQNMNFGLMTPLKSEQYTILPLFKKIK